MVGKGNFSRANTVMDSVFEFLFFYALFNLYVHTITFLYFPVISLSVSFEMEQLNNEEEEMDGSNNNPGFDDDGGASI